MLSVDGSVLVVFLLLLILVFVLSKLFFNPLRKVMDERKAKLKTNRDAAAKAIEEYEKSVRDIEESLHAARSNAMAVRDEFEQQALKEKDKMLKDVSQECRDQVNKARAEMEKQIQGLKKDLEKESQKLAKEIEKKLLD